MSARSINLRAGWAFLRAEFFNASVYRAAFWMNYVYTVLMMYSVGHVWRALYAANTAAAAKLPLDAMITYAVLGVALETIMHPHHGPQIYIAEQVRSGAIEMDIMKPIDFEFYMFCKTMGVLLVRFAFMVLPSLVLARLFFGLELPAPGMAAPFLISVALGAVVGFLLTFLLGLAGMVTMNIKNINWGYNATMRFFSGQMVPLWLFPGWLAALSMWLPFRCVNAIPISIYVGQADPLAGIALQTAWAVALLLITRLTMGRVFGRLMVQGG